MSAFLWLGLVAALALGATACGSASSPEQSGRTVRATLTAGGKTYVFTGGSCAVEGPEFTLRAGSGNRKSGRLGITVFGAKAGTYDNQTVAWQLGGGQHGSLAADTVTLAKGLKKGTFSGSLAAGGTGSGTFSCGT